MKVLVTGGAGFIGSNFIRYWLTQYPQDSVINLDALTYAGNLANLKDIEHHPRYLFVKGDIGDQVVVEPLVAEADTIVHFAAESHVDRSIVGPAAFVKTNIDGTFVLLEAARHQQKHFHHISTDEVFGALPLKSKEKFIEDSPYRPNSPYAASKAGSDHLVRAYHQTYQLPITLTNCSNNFGPYQHPEKFIPRMITNVIDGQPIKIYGDGLYVRDWLYVTDHCRAVDAVLKKGNVGDTYLVGGMTEEITNLDLAKLVLQLMKAPADQLVFVPDRPGHDRRYAVDWTKMKQELNWQPEHDFVTWLTATITWYQKNPQWWRPFKAKAENLYKRTKQ